MGQARFIAPDDVGHACTLAKIPVVRTKLASRVIYRVRLREQITEPIPATTRIEVASADVLNQLKALDQKQDEQFTSIKKEFASIEERQKRQDEVLFTHSKHISALHEEMKGVREDLKGMATKQDLATLKTAQDARFDQLEAARDEHNRKLDEQHEMLRQILRLIGQQPSS